MIADKLIDRLDGVQGKGPRWRAICPAHASRHKTRTLAIAEADDGRVLIKCFAGCGPEQIVAAVGLTLEDLFPPREALGSEQIKRRDRKPWSAREIALALQSEVGVALVILADVAAGRAIGASDRKRAAVAADRCATLLRELTA